MLAVVLPTQWGILPDHMDIYLLVLNIDFGKLINPINDSFNTFRYKYSIFLGKSAIIIQYISIYVYI